MSRMHLQNDKRYDNWKYPLTSMCSSRTCQLQLVGVCLPFLNSRSSMNWLDHLVPGCRGSWTVLNACCKMSIILSCIRWLGCPGFPSKHAAMISKMKGLKSSQYAVTNGNTEMSGCNICPPLRKLMVEGWTLLNHERNGALRWTCKSESTTPALFVKVQI